MKAMLISDVGWCKAMKDAFTQLGEDVDALLAEAGVDLETTESGTPLVVTRKDAQR